MAPSPPHFYNEFGPDWEDRYNWRHVPSTGPYYVKAWGYQQRRFDHLNAKEGLVGEQKANSTKYRYNPDKIVWTVVRDTNKAFELFRAGQLEMYRVTRPELWYEKCEIDSGLQGLYRTSLVVINDFPRPQFGLEINTSVDKLKDLNVRLGLSHAVHWDKVLNVIFWGDYNRLPGFVDGFGEFVNPEVRARPFDPKLAREYFAKAGFHSGGT